MMSSPMAVSPGETKAFRHRWRSLVCASLLFAALICGAALAEETRYFRIGTAATGGSFFEIGGGISGAPLGAPGAPACGEGGGWGGGGGGAAAPAAPGPGGGPRR